MKILYNYIPFQLLLGVVVGVLFSVQNLLLISLSTFVVFLYVLFVKLKHYNRTQFVFISIVFVGVVLAWLSVLLHNTTLETSHYLHLKTNKKTIIGCIVYKQVKATVLEDEYYARVIHINGQKYTGNVLVRFKKDSLAIKQHISLGDEIVCKARIYPVAKPFAPYSFSYKKYVASQHVYGQVYLKNNFVKVGSHSSFIWSLQDKRKYIIQKLYNSNLSKNTVGLLSAMLMGAKDELSNTVQQSFKNSGVIHLLAISGMHVGVLYVLLLYLLSFLKKYKYGVFIYVGVLLFSLWLFAVFSGLSTSVVRSVTMFSFMSLTYLKSGKRLLLEAIVSSLFVLLLIHPNYLYQVGFQLSYAAVIGIVIFYPIFNKKINNKALQYLYRVFLVSIIAQAATLPIILYYFRQIPLQSLITNLIAVSLLPIVLYGGILIVVSVGLHMSVSVVEKSYDVLIQYYLLVIDSLASLDGFLLKEVYITRIDVLFSYVLLFLLWMLLKQKKQVVYVLACLCLWQIVSVVQSYFVQEKSELIVFNKYNKTLIGIKEKQTLVLYGDTEEDSFLEDYIHQSQIKHIVKSNKQSFVFKGELYLIVNTSIKYEDLQVQHLNLILANAPKINLERVLVKLQPQSIIVSAHNYKQDVIKWKSTCLKLQVPFYDVANGFLRLD